MNNSDILRLIMLARYTDTIIKFRPDGSVALLALEFNTALEAARFLVPLAKTMKSEAEYRAEVRSERRAMGLV